jgi:hypothetical protein
MKMFVAIPFSPEYQSVYSAIQRAAEASGVEPIRADELLGPGPIVTQLSEAMNDAEFVVAEVSSPNPNVFYEIGIAHCSRKPTLLVAKTSALKNLPFDIRHNRVIAYDDCKPSGLTESLERHLKYLVAHHQRGAPPPSPEAYFSSLSDGRLNGGEVINTYVEQIAGEFKLRRPEVMEVDYSAREGYLITVRGAFGEEVVFSVDVNGRIGRRKRVA